MAQVGDIENGVLFGKDGWLFLHAGGHHQMDFLIGKRVPNAKSAENFKLNILDRRAYCEQRRIGYLHLVFPSKPVIMREYLPDDYAEKSESLFERVYAPCFGDALPNYMVYPRKLLADLKRTEVVFRKHDSHMTSIGYLAVVQEVFSRLGIEHDALQFLDSKAMVKIGDLTKMLNSKEKAEDIVYYVRGRTDVKIDNRQFLPSNTGNIAIVSNENSASEKRLIGIGDSFVKECISMLSTYFRDTLYIRSDLFQPELVDKFAPDVILTSNAERYLSDVRRDQPEENAINNLSRRRNYQPSEAFTTTLEKQLSRGGVGSPI